MNKREVNTLLDELTEDQKRDVLMCLAERFEYKVIEKVSGEDVTYYISTDFIDFNNLHKDSKASNA